MHSRMFSAGNLPKEHPVQPGSLFAEHKEPALSTFILHHPIALPLLHKTPKIRCDF